MKININATINNFLITRYSTGENEEEGNSVTVMKRNSDPDVLERASTHPMYVSIHSSRKRKVLLCDDSQNDEETSPGGNIQNREQVIS